jgi:outer membrane lipoprotein-sorting protein
MKKFLLYFSCILAIIFLAGCTMANTPKRKVENYLDNYRNLKTDVLTQLDEIISGDTTMDATQRTNYKEVLKDNMRFNLHN